MQGREYRVVVNHEEQYAIWLEGTQLEKGWKDAGCQGSLEETTAFIREVWTDMRPLSFRRSDPTSEHRVVINHEEQYAVWPAGRQLAGQWKDVGKSGDLKQASDYIEEVWTDMRPRSLRD